MKKSLKILPILSGLLLGMNTISATETKEINKTDTLKKIIIELETKEQVKNIKKELSTIKAKIKKLEKENKHLKEKLEEVSSTAEDTSMQVKPLLENNRLYFRYDLRTSVDILNYKTTNGEKEHNSLFTNRIILTAVAKPRDDLKATLRIEANSVFGVNGAPNRDVLSYDNMNWIANETPDDIILRVKEAFFNYYFGPANSIMISAGRRPGTNGFPANLRENDEENSPIAHTINMEFDGFSLEFTNEAIPKPLREIGTKLKICFGRGYSPNNGKLNKYPYINQEDLDINDFAGFITTLYDNMQYSLVFQYVRGWNIKGYDKDPTNGKIDFSKIKDKGNYKSYNLLFRSNGIGDGISDYLDDTIAFISLARTVVKPKKNETVMGSSGKKSGNSIWIGADMPAGENGRWGFNFVHGSKYFKPMTYGEDTLIGSIAAVRGNAYDLYFNYNITPQLIFSIRGTLIKYKYTGSNGFFGYSSVAYDINSPEAKQMNAIKSSSDIRIYIRYKF